MKTIGEWWSSTEAVTEEIGFELAAGLAATDPVFLVVGTMGSGKTVLVRGMARALGVPRREVQSPTYALIHEHVGAHGRLVHADLYRLEPGQIESTGLFDLLSAPGIKAIEWPELLGVEPKGACLVEIEAAPDGRRKITARML
jgi:tRNA threonylcarbamoyladenosine biosynthesis protein TsaE